MPAGAERVQFTVIGGGGGAFYSVTGTYGDGGNGATVTGEVTLAPSAGQVTAHAGWGAYPS